MNETNKLPFKRVDIALNKFNNVAIPHHLELLKKYQHNIRMYQKQHEWDRVRIEQNNATRLIKQLKQLLYEMDLLRSQVIEMDLDKFDQSTIHSKQTVQDLIKDYMALIKSISIEDQKNVQSTASFNDFLSNVDQLQIEQDVNNEIINEKKACFESAQELERNLVDLHTTFAKLQTIVHEQDEQVTSCYENVETANVNVQTGTLELAQALKYKKAMYPLTGAAIGTCLGGPIGFFAGLKFGSVAAVGCGITGYFGGKLLTENDKNIATDQQMNNSTTDKRTL